MRSGLLHERACFGARPSGDGTDFRVRATRAARVTLVLETGAAAGEHAMRREAGSAFQLYVAGARPGDLYRFKLDDGPPLPDPASRFQPRGVHGPSEIVDPAAFTWTDERWPGIDPDRAVIYELHVGTFTPEGTFAAAAARLPYLRDLGVTVVELMPVADFAGSRNWGYDGVALFAPARCYGRPDDLRRLVDAAHRSGLAVMLDVVYNHLGPDGAYMSTFVPEFFTPRHRSPWGDGVNVDGPGSDLVRRFFIENACHWVAEYHVDGLRLDATHAIADDSPTHIVSEIARAARQATPRRVMIVAEDHRNDARLLRAPQEGGWELDGVWADDFHHIMRRILAGDREGYYEDFEASVPDLVDTIQRGWFYTGQHSRHLGTARGTDPAGVPRRACVICLQNHDQIGNRAFGDRLHHEVSLAAYRAAAAVLLLAPETPLLFMGQEWAASTPFRYFTDHTPELGSAVVRGRRREFARFSAFSDPGARERIPSPQDPDSFTASRLKWQERDAESHRGCLRLHQRLLELRELALLAAPTARQGVTAAVVDEDTLALRCREAGREFLLVARLRGSGSAEVPALPAHGRVLLTTEDPEFAPDGRPPRVLDHRIEFACPAAVLFA